MTIARTKPGILFRTGIALAILFALSGCYNLDTDEFTKTKPSLQDLVGTYLLTDYSATSLRERSGDLPNEISIKLSPDGSCSLLNIPDSWGENHTPVKFVSRIGKWELVQNQNYWIVALEDLNPAGSWPETPTQLNIIGEKPPYILWITLGDADEGHVLGFSKR